MPRKQTLKLAPLVLASALLGACSLARPVNTSRQTGSDKLKKLAARVDQDPESAKQGYYSYLATHQGFDQGFDACQDRFMAAMEALNRDEYSSVSSDGLQYYYNEHVAAVCQAQLGLARAYGKTGDWVAAERWADNAERLASARGMEPVIKAEVSRDAWMVKRDAFKAAKQEELQAWADSHLQIIAGALSEPAMLQDYKQLFAARAASQKQLAEANDFIAKVNAKHSQEVGNTMLAATAAAGQVANQYASSLNQQAYAKGEIDQSTYQMTQMNVNMNQANLNNMLQTSLVKAGKFGDVVALGYAFAGSGVLDQFMDPNSHTQPTQIMSNFVGKARELGRGDTKFVQMLDSFNDANSVLQGARTAKSPQQIKAAMDGFMPAYQKVQGALHFRASSAAVAASAGKGEGKL